MANYDERELIPQPHGGALRPFARGNGAASSTPWRATRRAAMDLLREASPEAARTLVQHMQSPDARVSFAACVCILDRTMGRSGAEWGNDASAGPVSLSHLTGTERIELTAALATVTRLIRLASCVDRCPVP